MKKWIGVMILLALGASAALAGGQVNISVQPLPRSITAGQAFAVEFKVEYPDGSPTEGLAPVIVATKGRDKVVLHARATPTPGRYLALVKLPRDGRWNLVVDVRHCGNTAVLRDVVALRAKPGRANG